MAARLRGMGNRGRVVGLALGLHGFVAPGAHAFELVSVSTARDGAAYLLRIEARFEASPEQLLAVLTDYAHIHELHPRMVESRSLGRIAPDTEEVYSRFEGCVLVFCRTVYRLEHITRSGHTLVAHDVPGRGSFREGRTEWQFDAADQGALLSYEARFVPAFRVAPVFGAQALARSAEQMAIETMQEAERLALAGHD